MIESGKLVSEKQNGRHIISLEKTDSQVFRELLLNKYAKQDRSPYFPEELTDYHEWHQTLDFFSWLLKVCYSSRSEVQTKSFNIQRIFENYLATHNVRLSQIKSQFLPGKAVARSVVDDLKRGWYNELAFIYPLKESTLGVSFRDISKNQMASTERFSFPSWKITESYYSFYFYLRSITQLKNTTFRIEEHKSTLTSFKNNALANLKKTIWKFPFDIEYKPTGRFDVRTTLAFSIPHLQYQYSFHPRPPRRRASDIAKEIHKSFRKRSRRFTRPFHYTIFDFLLEFRIWANYLDIDNLLSLWGGGFKAFLDQNLSLLLFFAGGMTELIFLAVFGEKKYISELQNIYDLFATNNREIKDNFRYTSLYQRMRIYKILDYISTEIKIPAKINENEVT